MTEITTNVDIGRMAPPFRLPSADGAEVGLEDYRGRANVILFFAKGMACSFCRQKMSQLGRGLARFREFDTEIVMVSPTTPGRAQFYARNFQLPFPYLCDPDYRVYETYGMPPRPHSVVWKARVLRHVLRIPEPESDFGPAKPSPAEIPRVMNDDDLGFFVVDKAGLVRYASHGPYVVFDGVRPVGMHAIPSNDEIVEVLGRCGGAAAAERRPA